MPPIGGEGRSLVSDAGMFQTMTGSAAALAVVARPHPLGTVCIAWSSAGIARSDLTDDLDGFAERVESATQRSIQVCAAPSALVDAIDQTFDCVAAEIPAIDWRGVSVFQRDVLEQTARIPPGEMRSYGWVADHIGCSGAARAVGTALARNPVPFLLPCHRVGRADGSVGRYLYGSEMKERLLAHEAEAAGRVRGARGRS